MSKLNTLYAIGSSAALAGALMLASMSGVSASPDIWKYEWPKTDFTKTSVDFKEIKSGGVPKDAIPSIPSPGRANEKPKFIAAADDNTLGDKEPVVGLEINGDARAYPLRILTWHEIVNDVVGGTPVTITYCPLCNSAVVFERTLDGKVLDFGTTGKLRFSDLVMYDRQTESWWQQFIGQGIVGEYTGRSLKTVPARLESFERFKARHKDGKLLVPNNPGMRNYGQNPYRSYDTRDGPYGFYNGPLPEGINPMARVVVVRQGGKSQAVAMELLRKKGTLQIGKLVYSWTAGQNSALDSSVISEGRDVGNITVQRKTPDGMKDVPYDVTFAFVFHAFNPKETIVKS